MASSTAPMLTEELLRKLPKVDVHRHLDGSVRVETILSLAEEQGVELPTHDLEELRALVTVGDDCASLEEYLVGFGIVNKVTQKPYALTRIFFEACEDAVEDGLRYVELRFAPILHANELMSLTEVMEAVCEGQAMAEYHLPIKARIIVCGMRHMPPSATMSVAEIAWRYRNRGVVAFDLAGPEAGFRSSEHKDAFELVQKQMLRMTVHSGEAAGPESILDAIRYCGAHRIGHGTSLGESPELLEYVVDRGIPLEVCPTSNVQTKAVASLAAHPMKEYVDAGVTIVVCTDNPAISQCTLSSELLACHQHMGLTVADIVRLIDNGFRTTFLERGTRARLRADALYQTVAILRSEGFDVSPIVNDPYYHSANVNFNKPLGAVYWGTFPVPPITTDIVHALPKVDAHRRLSGSASLPVVWECLVARGDAIDLAALTGLPAPVTYDAFAALVRRASHTRESVKIAKALFDAALQTEAAVRASLADIYARAAADNFMYIELVVSPVFHTSGDLTMESLVDVVLACKGELEAEHGIESGIILSTSVSPATLVDPLDFRTIAELAVANHCNGVCGFAAYGSQDLAPSEYKFYQSTFDYLKDASMPVAIAAGSQSPGTVIAALSEGGAARLSGGFQIHHNPNLFNYVADRGIALELGMTDKLKLHTADTDAFTPSPVKLFLDNDISIAICSFREQLYTFDLCESIAALACDASINIAYLLKLLSGGINALFVSRATRLRLQAEWWARATRIAHDAGFVYLHLVHYHQVPHGHTANYQYGAYATNAPTLDMDLFINRSLALRAEKEAEQAAARHAAKTE